MKRQRQLSIEEIEEQWTCPITSMPMTDPVVTQDGHSYEKRQITAWLKKQKSSPKTGLSLKKVGTIPNIALRNVIQKFQTQIKYQIQKLKIQNTQLLQKLSEKEQNTKQSEQQRVSLQSELKQMTLKYEQLLQKQKQVTEVFESLQRDNQELRINNQRLKDQLIENNKKLVSNLSFGNTQQKINHLEKQINSLKKQPTKSFEELKKQNFDLNNKLIILNMEKNSLNNIIDNFSTYKTNFQSAKKNFEEQLQKIINLQIQMQKQKINYQNSDKLKNDEISSLKVQLSKQKKLNDKLTKENQKKINYFLNLQTQNKQLKDDLQKNRILSRENLRKKVLIENIPQKKEKQMVEEKQQNIKSVNVQQTVYSIKKKFLQNRQESEEDQRDKKQFTNRKLNQKMQLKNDKQQIKIIRKNNPMKISRISAPYVLGHSHQSQQLSQQIEQQLQNVNQQSNHSLQQFQQDNSYKQHPFYYKNIKILNPKQQKPIQKITLVKPYRPKNTFPPIIVQKIDELKQNPINKEIPVLNDKVKLNSQIPPNIEQKSSIQVAKNHYQFMYGQVNLQKNQHILPFAAGSSLAAKLIEVSSEKNAKNIKKQLKDKTMKLILPKEDYLMNHPVLYDQQKHQLNHSGLAISMEDFLMHNWEDIVILDLSDCELQDKGFQIFVNEAKHFPNLVFLLLWTNTIANLPKLCLERFPKLKAVYFSVKGKFHNPLNERSKKYLENFKKQHSSIQVYYESY